MLARLSAAWGRLRRALSRSHLTARLLGHPPEAEDGRAGALVIQIDGLGRAQFEAALRRGRMPFLQARLRSDDGTLRTFYPGMPSTTPAVQSELFYGVRCAVPAFGFVRRAEGRDMRMMRPGDVDQLAADLAERGTPLLADGTAYGDILAGGSAEARYCTQTLELESFLRVVNPLKAVLILLLHATTVVRLVGYMAAEMGLAVFDAVRGVLAHRSLLGELKFIPMRVAVCIGLRELVRFRVKNDLIRGIPMIHANFIGYDEQAHRRGPTSAFAHWSLKGIDGVIQDLVRSAERSPGRRYQVVIYSDHGQEDTESYQRTRGASVAEAVVRALGGGPGESGAAPSEPSDASGPENRRRRAGALLRADGRAHGDAADDGIDRIRVSAIGPLGHIYLPGGPADPAEEAQALVREAEIPLVLFVDGAETAAVTPAGRFSLERNAAAVLGADHPLADRVAEDLAALCRHPDAGDFVISGWRPGARPLTFPVENGAHGGPGREESRGFVLLPRALDTGAAVLRPADLRERIQHLRSPSRARTQSAAPPRTGIRRRHPEAVRVVTYNIHGGRGLDGRIGIDPIAEVLSELAPDLVALQEVDVRRRRSDGCDQAAALGAALGMTPHFFPVMRYGDECYGLAALSRLPVHAFRNARLPGPPGPGRERRGAVRLTVSGPDGEWDLINTHLGLGLRERRRQAAALLSDGWIRPGIPTVLCGDFNAGPRSPVCRRIGTRLRPAGDGAPTFFAPRPLLRLDHLFVSDPLRVSAAGVGRSATARRASDHLPAWADLRPGEGSP